MEQGSLQEPWNRKISSGLRAVGVHKGCRPGSLKQTVGEHQGSDERQEENCVCLVRLPKSLRHLIAHGFKYNAPHDRKHHAKKNHGGCVVRDDLVQASEGSGKPRHYEVIRHTNDQDSERTQSEENESRKHQDVKNSGKLVPWMPPL